MLNRNTKLKGPLLFIPIGVFVLTAFWYFVFYIPVPSTKQEFKSKWASVQPSKRERLLPWLLNTEPERYEVYPVNQTRLDGFSIEDVDELMGRPDRMDSPSLTVETVQDTWGEITIYSYKLGMLEKGLIGSLIVPWQDYLIIIFDEEGSVVRVETNE